MENEMGAKQIMENGMGAKNAKEIENGIGTKR